MSHYHHISIEEREKILILLKEGKSIRAIAIGLRRAASSISREIMRNTKCKAGYSAVEAEKKYRQRRKRCRRENLLKNTERLELVRSLFLDRNGHRKKLIED